MAAAYCFLNSSHKAKLSTDTHCTCFYVLDFSSLLLIIGWVFDLRKFNKGSKGSNTLMSIVRNMDQCTSIKKKLDDVFFFYFKLLTIELLFPNTFLNVSSWESTHVRTLSYSDCHSISIYLTLFLRLRSRRFNQCEANSLF